MDGIQSRKFMTNNKNLFISILIVFGFIVAWDSLVVSKFGPPKNSKTSSSTTQPISTPNLTTAPSVVDSNVSQIKSLTVAPAKSVVLTAGNARVEMDSLGARIASWKTMEKEHWVEFVYTGKTPKLFPLETYPDVAFGLESSSENKAVYSAKLPSGLILRKTLDLSSSSSLHTLTLEFANPTKQSVQLNTEFGWGSGLNKRAINAKTGAVRADSDPHNEMRAIGLADHLRQWKSGVIFGRTVDTENTGPFQWVGVDNKHFLAALIPTGGMVERVHAISDKSTAPTVLIPVSLTIQPNEKKIISYQLYVGPKKTSELKLAGHGLDQSISFGVFGIIAKTLLRGLEFFHKLTGNYGWAIIILTICIQILVFPLTRKSLEHSVKMRTLQPQLKSLQEQFKSDPKRLQVETLNLYKKNGMQFMGLEGCFPMLFQIPIFFAFYTALNGAFELRGATWIFWIKDLAAPDPYYVLPILMGAGMFLQQKLTTVAADPAQARMAMLMPIMFVFMFFKMPAGLVLYWTMNSVCTIVNQRFLLLKQSSTTPVTRL